jgi:hypothetical protein
MAKRGGGEPNGQTDLYLIPKTRHPAPRIPLFLPFSLSSTRTSACHAIAAFTRTVASSGENEKTKELTRTILSAERGRKTKEKAAGFEETSESQTRKAVFPGHF